MEVGNIVKGHINEMLGLNKDLSEERLSICKECPIYSPKFGGVCNNSLWINPENENVSVFEKDGYVRGCGCRLKAKTALPDAKCIINKW